MTFSLEQTITVFEDPDSSSRSHNAAFPSILRCRDGSLLLAHRAGSHKNSADGVQYLWRSRDEGFTWNRIPFPFEPSGRLVEQRTASLSSLDANRISMLLTWIEHRDTASSISNPATEGLQPVHIGWSVSADCGVTWSQLREISISPLSQPCGNGGILRLESGRLLAAFETYKHYDDPAAWSARSAYVISSDDGQTWIPRIAAEDPAHRLYYWDHHFYLLSNGNVLAAGWVDDKMQPGESRLSSFISRNEGKSWERSRALEFQGQYSDLLQLPGGKLALIYVVRQGEPGIRVRFGDPRGEVWDGSDALVLYQQNIDDLEATRGRGFGGYLAGMGQWTFGWPSAILLDARTALVSYYAGVGNFTSIRIARVGLDRSAL